MDFSDISWRCGPEIVAECRARLSVRQVVERDLEVEASQRRRVEVLGEVRGARERRQVARPGAGVRKRRSQDILAMFGAGTIIDVRSGSPSLP